VNSDPAAASTKAGLLLNSINGVDKSSLSVTEREIFVTLQDKLSFDARHISEVQKIDHQREHFASLSLNMYKLAKAVRLSVQPVYQEYCPMKKSYWLSNEPEIKNPYFGKQMLTCGSITNTIKWHVMLEPAMNHDDRDHRKMGHESNPAMGRGGHNHHAMMIGDFRKRFYVVLGLTIPIMLLSTMIQEFMGVDWQFPGTPAINAGMLKVK
jgi:uncharacterized protein DUF3347